MSKQAGGPVKSHAELYVPACASVDHGAELPRDGNPGDDLVTATINQCNVFNVLRGNWDPTDKKFSSVNAYRQDLSPTCKAFPQETTTSIGFPQCHKVCNVTTVLQERSKCCDLIWLYAGQSNTKCCSSSTQSNDLHTRHSLSVLSR